MAHVESAPQDSFTPSLGLRWWMNKMRKSKPPKAEPTCQIDDDVHDAAGDSVMDDDVYLNFVRIGQNDSVSNLSASEKASASNLGVSQDLASSLRVLYPYASSETESCISEDIKSNASIKSKPWVSKPVDHPAQQEFIEPPSPSNVSDHSSADISPAQRIVKLKGGIGKWIGS
ncbi:hypothetical protein BC940DRAFT_370256 [Gongronella butleri]|nr:hypothetical protein BC940DRAFT_370256 [Gongronella butleri]